MVNFYISTRPGHEALRVNVIWGTFFLRVLLDEISIGISVPQKVGSGPDVGRHGRLHRGPE